MSELSPINLVDFSGGLNLRRSQFSLAGNESPEMLNVEVDERLGFFTRPGMRRMNAADIIGTVANWHPRNAYFHQYSDGTTQVYAANAAKIHAAAANGVFSDLSVPCNASTHLADFAPWGDTVYIATGSNAAALTSTPVKRVGTAAVVALSDAAAAFNDDYTTPVRGTMPFADLAETHSGYLFTACTKEGGTTYRTRLRWSHPSEPEDWATNDYIDINAGGGAITALMSFGDHLLIFKNSSIWALYGYNSESWQLVQIPGYLGAPTPTAVARTENGALFFSASGKIGVHSYTGGLPEHVSEQLDTAMEQITDPPKVWLGWVAGKLWVSIPWTPSFVEGGVTTYMLDPGVGRGAWTQHQPALGSLVGVVSGSDAGGSPPLGIICGCSGAACMVKLGVVDAAEDFINLDTTGTAFAAFYKTGWQSGEWPERRKSWRRPRFVAEYVKSDVSVDIETFWDYNESAPRRSHTISLTADGTVVWSVGGSGNPDGADWGDGSTWGAATLSGSVIVRAQPPGPGISGLGVTPAVQMKLSTSSATAGKAWGISAIILKYRLRRFTT